MSVGKNPWMRTEHYSVQCGTHPCVVPLAAGGSGGRDGEAIILVVVERDVAPPAASGIIIRARCRAGCKQGCKLARGLYTLGR